MNLSNFNLKAFLVALGCSLVVFFAFYFLNHPPTTVSTNNAPNNSTISNKAQIPALEHTSETTVPINALDSTAYQQTFKTLIQSTSFAAASALDSFDVNPAILLESQTTAGKQLLIYLDQLSANYNQAQYIQPPQEYAALHAELTNTLQMLNQANIHLQSSATTGDNQTAALGYNQLQTGYNQITALATRL